MTARSWPPRDLEKALSLWNDGASGSEVGRAIGRSRTAVLGMMYRLRQAGDRRITRGERAEPTLTPEQARAKDQETLYILQRHEDDGASFLTIGNELGRSSQSVRLEYIAVTTALVSSEL